MDALEVFAIAGGERQVMAQCRRGDLAVLRGNRMPAAGALGDEQRVLGGAGVVDGCPVISYPLTLAAQA
jgi:hypothetical protein